MNEEKNVINDLVINLRITGEGFPLLILHGWGGSSDSWKQVQKLLSIKYKVIVPDLPGFGKSEAPKIAWGIQDYSDFILDLLKKLETKEIILLGHSFGGRIAIRLSVSYPEKVKRLIICGSAGIKQKWGKKEKIAFFLAKIGNVVFTPRILNRFRDRARNIFYSILRRKDYAKAKGIMKETIKKVMAEDLLPELPLIKNKTLIIWGGKDKMVPLKYAHLFKEKIGNSELEIIPKIGHSPHLETPDKLSEIIFAFLKS